MAFCRNCGEEIEDGLKSCPACGTATGTAPRKKTAQQPIAEPAKTGTQTDKGKSGSAKAEPPQSKSSAAKTKEPTYDEQEDIKTNKAMAALAYLLFFLPLVTEPAKTSKFARFHANQGLVFLIFYVGMIILTRVLSAVLWWPLLSSNVYGLWIFFEVFFWLIFVAMTALAAWNAYQAYQGKWRKLLLIGKITILK